MPHLAMQEDVVQLDVAVGDAHAMAVVDRHHDLLEEQPRDILRQSLALRSGSTYAYRKTASGARLGVSAAATRVHCTARRPGMGSIHTCVTVRLAARPQINACLVKTPRLSG